MDIRNARERMDEFFLLRGWKYASETLMHLMEEMRELTWYVRQSESSTNEKVEDEVPDVLSLVLHTANVLKVDAEGAWLRKLEKDERRFPITEKIRP